MRRKSSKDVCSLCGGRLEEKTVCYVWERGDQLAVIEDVVAKVCQRCGHRWYPAKSARALEAAFSGEQEPVGTLEVPVYSLGQVEMA
jgi:YgiT-type zinc finger domain-containing protein